MEVCLDVPCRRYFTFYFNTLMTDSLTPEGEMLKSQMGLSSGQQHPSPSCLTDSEATGITETNQVVKWGLRLVVSAWTE